MKYFSKILSIFAFIIVIALSGCNKNQQTSDIKEIGFWTLQLSSFAPYINSVINDYEKLHPDVKIKWIDVPFSEGEKRALAAVMSNKVPDIINMNPSFASTLASRGALVDLEKYVSKEKYETYLKEGWQASTLGNTVFGVPWYITSSITIYNTEFLKKSGINPDKPPKNYSDLIEYAKIIKEKTGKYAFMPNLTEDGQLIKILNKNNIPILNKDRTKALFNTPQAVEELSLWVYLYKNDYIPRESLTEGHRTSLERYQAGESAFILTGANFLNMIKDNAPDVYKKTKVAPQVVGDNNKVDFAIMNLVIPAKSRHPKEAVDFALYITNTKNQLEFCKLAPILPSTIAGINSEFFKTKSHKNLIEQGRAISANQLNNAITPIPPLKNQKDLFELVDFATQQALLDQKTPKQALDDAVMAWNQLLKEK